MSEDRDNIRELLSAYIDGEVTQEQSDSVEQAVAEDPELALELHELNSAKQLVMGLSHQRAPRDFVRKVMVQAERRHLLGDRRAGGAFGAARWITLAAAAVVLLAAGIGIIAIDMLKTDRNASPIASLDAEGDGPGRTVNKDINGGFPHGKGGGKGAGTVTANGGVADRKLVVADAVLDYAVANAKNASIYTHDVSNTLAAVNETLGRNNVLPMEWEVPGGVAGGAYERAAKTAERKRRISHGEGNISINSVQNDEQVQILVLADDAAIEQINGAIDKLAGGQLVSQAPAADLYKLKSVGGYVARRSGPRTPQTEPDPSDRDKEAIMIARRGDALTGLGERSEGSKAGKAHRIRAKGEKKTDGEPDIPSGRKPTASGAPVVREIAKPAVEPPVSEDGDANTQLAVKPAPKPAPAKRPAPLPPTRPQEPGQTAGGIRKDISGEKDSRELGTQSSRTAETQKQNMSHEELKNQLSRLNNTARQKIWNDDIIRNVQSQQDRGVNIQALIININRRSLKTSRAATTRNSIPPRSGRPLSRPHTAAKSAPVSKSTTQQGPPETTKP